MAALGSRGAEEVWRVRVAVTAKWSERETRRSGWRSVMATLADSTTQPDLDPSEDSMAFGDWPVETKM